MNRLWTSLFSTLLAVSLLAGSAEASCIPLSPVEKVAHAEAIVYGKVARVEQPLAGGTYVLVTVEKVFKGNPPNPLLIHSQSGRTMATSVDYNMAAGEDHTLYLAKGEGGNYSVNTCTGSHRGAPRSEELQVLGPGRDAPAPGKPPKIPMIDPPAEIRYWIPWIAVGGVAAVILLVLVGPRLLRRR